MTVDRDDVARLTEEYGGTWGINHTRRLLHLVEIIGEGLSYQEEAIWLAAHLHDWGAYAPWAQPGIDHAVRSVQVADAWLAERQCPEKLKSLVIECIQFHHSAGSDCSLEAILLRDADVLDFLGAVGVLRDFSKNPRDLRKAFDVVRKRRAKLPGTLHIQKAREIGAERAREMDVLLEQFQAESFGCF